MTSNKPHSHFPNRNIDFCKNKKQFIEKANKNRFKQ